MSFTLDEIRVATNLAAIAEKWYSLTQVPRRVLLAITWQEDGWQDSNPGDGGHSDGPFQIYDGAYPWVSEQIKTSPWWDYGFPAIWQRWRDEWAPYAGAWAFAGELIQIGFIQYAAPAMQGSIPWTWAQAERAYSDAVAMEAILDAGSATASTTG